MTRGKGIRAKIMWRNKAIRNALEQATQQESVRDEQKTSRIPKSMANESYKANKRMNILCGRQPCFGVAFLPRKVAGKFHSY